MCVTEREGGLEREGMAMSLPQSETQSPDLLKGLIMVPTPQATVRNEFHVHIVWHTVCHVMNP